MAVLAAGIPWVKQQFFDNNGEVCAGWFLYVYKAGTTLKATTWTDKDLTTKNANPIVLDSAGRASIFVDRTTAYKYVLTKETADPPQSPIWTHHRSPAIPFYSVNYNVVLDDASTQAEWLQVAPNQTLYAPQNPVMLYSQYVGNGAGTDSISLPAGTFDDMSPSDKGDGLVLEWEADYTSATLSARSEAFGTAVDIGTGAASTATRARYFFYRATSTDIHVSTTVWQNTGAGAVQVQMGQQTLGSLDLDNVDYTVDMKMSAGTWTIRGARAYFGRAFGDWTAR